MTATPLKRRVRVLVADDHPITRTGVEAVIRSDLHLHLVGEAHSFSELCQRLADEPVDVLVLDLNGMGTAPLVMVREIHQHYPDLGIVVFSSATDLIPEILAEGAHGYVVKEEMTAHVLAAITTVARRQRYLSPIAEDYLSRATSTERPHIKLSPNERQVLHLLAQGLGTTKIADEMSIDPRTVQNYITGLRRKTGCEERTQLVAWYVRMSVRDLEALGLVNVT